MPVPRRDVHPCRSAPRTEENYILYLTGTAEHKGGETAAQGNEGLRFRRGLVAMGTDVGARFDRIEQTLAWFGIIGMKIVMHPQAAAVPGGDGDGPEEVLVYNLHEILAVIQ
jgi:hypothetical protein